jgi:hypothetical protein
LVSLRSPSKWALVSARWPSSRIRWWQIRSSAAGLARQVIARPGMHRPPPTRSFSRAGRVNRERDNLLPTPASKIALDGSTVRGSPGQTRKPVRSTAWRPMLCHPCSSTRASTSFRTMQRRCLRT